MTGTARSSDGLDARRKKLLFRSWHRGTREMDLVLGSFADAAIATLTEAEIDQYEELLELSDTELFPCITGERPVPAAWKIGIFMKVLAFSRDRSS